MSVTPNLCCDCDTTLSAWSQCRTHSVRAQPTALSPPHTSPESSVTPEHLTDQLAVVWCGVSWFLPPLSLGLTNLLQQTNGPN